MKKGIKIGVDMKPMIDFQNFVKGRIEAVFNAATKDFEEKHCVSGNGRDDEQPNKAVLN